MAQFIFDENQSYERHETLRLILCLLIAGLVYPLWGLAFDLASAETTKYTQFHYTFGILLMGTAAALYKTKTTYINVVRLCNVAVFVLFLHVAWQVYQQNYSILSLAALFIGYTTVFMALLHKRVNIYLALFASASTGVLVYFSPTIEITATLAIASLSSIGFGLFTNYARALDIERRFHAKQMTRRIFRSMHEGLVIHDKTGKITQFNDSAMDILGLTADQLNGKTSFDPSWKAIKSDGSPFPPQEHPAMVTLTTGKPLKNISMGIMDGNNHSRWILINSSPLYEIGSKNVESVMVTFADVTEIKKQEEQISAQKIRLLTSARLNALGEMAAGIAHEINNPLAILNMSHDLLKNGLKKTGSITPDIEKYLEKIDRMIFRIDAIVKSIRALARDGRTDPFQVVEFNEILSSIRDLIGPKVAKSGIELEIQHQDDLYVNCRSTEIGQVLLNLIQNSLDAVSQSEIKKISIRVLSDAKNVQILVEDSGPGIPKELEDKIMVPFFTTKPPGKGTGIGLSICREIISAHAGEFYYDFESPVSRFVIKLPRAEAPAAKAI